MSALPERNDPPLLQAAPEPRPAEAMRPDLFEQASWLKAQGQPFVLATVVRVEKPASARPGARAILLEDGALLGWVGGSCAESQVRREARQALQDGQPRLLRLSPPEKRASLPQEGVVEAALACASGGLLEIFLEPVLPPPRLVVVGNSPITRILASLGKSLGFSVTAAVLEATAGQAWQADRLVESLALLEGELGANACVVVASHGHYDEEALRIALQSPAAYVALVASRARAEAVRDYLRSAGLAEERLERLKSPAGLDLGAVTPEEVALSILAEIVHLRRRGGLGSPQAKGPSPTARLPAEARDPVCGMTVEIASARYTFDFDGSTYYFCARSCQDAFAAQPERYLA